MKLVRLAILSVALGATGLASAQTLWYNGDFNGVNGLNVSGAGGFDSRVYDDFNLGSASNVSGVFMHVLSAEDPAGLGTFAWEIRSGMSLGNGGTVVASGTDAASVTLTGFTGFGRPEYSIEVSGLNVNLAAGTYWLGGKIVGTGGNDIYLSTTSGANAVGTPAGNNDNSFWDSSSFGMSWVAASDGVGFPADFSMGVKGSAVPEPASMAVLGLGAAALLRRRKK